MALGPHISWTIDNDDGAALCSPENDHSDLRSLSVKLCVLDVGEYPQSMVGSSFYLAYSA